MQQDDAQANEPPLGTSRPTTTFPTECNLKHIISHDSVVCNVRFSWDGGILATGSNRVAKAFDVSSGRQVATFNTVSTSASGAASDATEGDCYVRAVCFSPDGYWLVGGAEDNLVRIWDIRTRAVTHELRGHDHDVYTLDIDQSNRFIASGSGDKRVKLWLLDGGSLLSTLGNGDTEPGDGITSVAISPDGLRVAASCLDRVVRVWDVETSAMVARYEGHEDSVYSIAFAPDGKSVLSGSLDNSVRLWDINAEADTPARIMNGHRDFVLSVTFSPDGKFLISSSKDGTVQFWDARSDAQPYVAIQRIRNSIISVAHDPNVGSRCIATGSGDGRARTWNYSYY